MIGRSRSDLTPSSPSSFSPYPYIKLTPEPCLLITNGKPVASATKPVRVVNATSERRKAREPRLEPESYPPSLFSH